MAATAVVLSRTRAIPKSPTCGHFVFLGSCFVFLCEAPPSTRDTLDLQVNSHALSPRLSRCGGLGQAAFSFSMLIGKCHSSKHQLPRQPYLWHRLIVWQRSVSVIPAIKPSGCFGTLQAKTHVGRLQVTMKDSARVDLCRCLPCKLL